MDIISWRINKSTGEILELIDFKRDGFERAINCCLTPDGGVLVTGWKETTPYSAILMKFDSSLSLKWAKQIFCSYEEAGAWKTIILPNDRYVMMTEPKWRSITRTILMMFDKNGNILGNHSIYHKPDVYLGIGDIALFDNNFFIVAIGTEEGKIVDDIPYSGVLLAKIPNTFEWSRCNYEETVELSVSDITASFNPINWTYTNPVYVPSMTDITPTIATFYGEKTILCPK